MSVKVNYFQENFKIARILVDDHVQNLFKSYQI